jgi:acid phosphatase (class A)
VQKLSIVLLGGVSAVCILVSAQTPASVVFVTAEQMPVVSFLPAPPAGDSAATRAELAELHHLQDTRTPAEVAHAKADDAEEDIFIFRDVLGDRFIKENLPLTALLGDHGHGNEGVVVNPAKNYFKRPRPYQFDTTLKPVCKTTANTMDYSYPSGHSTTGYLEALTVALIVPEKRDALLARADDYAHSRLVCGVHFPADPRASRLVAYSMIGLMMSNEEFKKELEAARAETRKVLGL